VQVFQTLTAKMESIPGAMVENNKFCLSVHFRCVDEEEWDGLGEEVRAVLDGYPDLCLTKGRKVLEIRPSIKWDKGNALEFLLESLGELLLHVQLLLHKICYCSMLSYFLFLTELYRVFL
jgi:trehalose 6-phosphate phosphatase